jgi:hypothetical protein
MKCDFVNELTPVTKKYESMEDLEASAKKLSPGFGFFDPSKLAKAGFR